jgi:hypothetical protein
MNVDGFREKRWPERRRHRGETRTLPCAGIIQIRFKGYFSPAAGIAEATRDAGPPRKQPSRYTGRLQLGNPFRTPPCTGPV